MQLNPFKHSVALDALTLTSVLTPLLHQYRTGLDQAVLANQVQIVMSVDYQGNAADAWMAVPADGENGFMKVAARVSLQLQKTLRAWLEMYWFSDPENLADTTRTAQLIGYLACRLYVPKTKGVYNYDLLDDWSPNAIERHIRTDMSDVLSRISNLLRILGRHDLADYYNPEHVSWFIGEVQRNRKQLLELLARETRIINAWVPLLGKALSARQLEAARRETRTALNEILRRGEDLSWLAPLFEMEAVAAVELYIGRPAGRRLTLSGAPVDAPRQMALAKVIPFPTVEQRLSRQRDRAEAYALVDDQPLAA
jgi:hypothetical protein